MIVTSRVALRKESVDRNLFRLVYMLEGAMSLSARRAWIEIISPDIRAVVYRSLSARRAWIEITISKFFSQKRRVALRKESVDRNRMLALAALLAPGSLSARRAWIEMVKSSYQDQP